MLTQFETKIFTEQNLIEKDKRKEQGITFTPLKVVEEMFSLLNLNNFHPLYTKILEPSCGKGIFIIYYLNYLFEKKIICNVNAYNILSNIYAFDIEDKFIQDLKNDIRNILINNNIIIDNRIENALNENIKVQNFLEYDTNIKFDLIIGNPPYVRVHNLSLSQKEFLKNNFSEVFNGLADLSIYFTYKSMKLLSKNGILLFITSNKFITSKYGNKFRKMFFKNLYLYNTKNLDTFKDVQIDTAIIGFNSFDNKTCIYNSKEIFKTFSEEKEWVFETIEKNSKKSISFKDIHISISNGLVSGFNDAHIISKELYTELINKDDSLKEILLPVLGGKDLDLKNNTYTVNKYIIYAIEENLSKISNNEIIMAHLNKFREGLENRSWYKSQSNKPAFFKLQGSTQVNIKDTKFNYLTKRIGELKFIKVPKEILYLDTIYNLIYPTNFNPDLINNYINKTENINEFISISNKIGTNIEIHKNKFERILVSEEEAKTFLK